MSDPTADRSGPGAEVAPGVYRFGSRRVNWYVVEGDDGLAVVDAGVPGHWEQLVSGVADLGYGLEDVAGLVLTHGHSDHVGFAERLRETADAPVLVHEADAAMVGGDVEDAPVTEVLLNLWRPAFLGLIVELARGGGMSITPVERVETFGARGDGSGAVELDVPGRLRAIHVPGHSAGSCAIHFPDRDVLFCGDALATLDIRTGRRGDPMLMSLFNADHGQAADSLERLAGLGEVTLLPGHGDPWRGDAADAIRSARDR